MTDRGPFLAWQLATYADNHTRRATLVVHLLTVPLFWAGIAIAAAAPWIGLWSLLAAPMLLAPVAAQGAMHRREPVAPKPFLGPGDFVRRIVAEQLITFPRWLLGGGLLRGWRDGA